MALVEVSGFSFAYPAEGARGAPARTSSCSMRFPSRSRRGDFCLLVGSTGSQDHASALAQAGAHARGQARRLDQRRGEDDRRGRRGRLGEGPARSFACGVGVVHRVRHAKPRGSDRVRHRVARACVRLERTSASSRTRCVAASPRWRTSSASGHGCAHRWRRCRAARSSWSTWRPSWPCARVCFCSTSRRPSSTPMRSSSFCSCWPA